MSELQTLTGVIIDEVVYKVESTHDKAESPCKTCDLYELCALNEDFHNLCINMLQKDEGFIMESTCTKKGE